MRKEGVKRRCHKLDFVKSLCTLALYEAYKCDEMDDICQNLPLFLLGGWVSVPPTISHDFCRHLKSREVFGRIMLISSHLTNP